MKLCVNCKYFKAGASVLGSDVCSHSKAPEHISLVSGYKSFRLAVVMRLDENLCGKDAILFEEKPTLWSKIKWLVKKN